MLLSGSSVLQGLERLDRLGADAIVFVVDNKDRLLGSLTDGDVRRGLLRGKGVEAPVDDIIQRHAKTVSKDNYSLNDIIEYRNNDFRVIPVLNGNNEIVNIINFRFQSSYLPVDAVIMAGGRGSRLRPLTDTTPKPLLKIGNKPIIDHSLHQLRKYGIDDYWISVRYLGEQLEEHFGNGQDLGVHINYVWEDEPLGTIGAVSKIDCFHHDHVLITNSDILTNLNYEDFYLDFLEKEADMAVVTIPYEVNIPYAVMETSNHHVLSFQEKPTYTYYSNGGIYLVKKDLLKWIPQNTFYNSTDLMEKVIQEGLKLISYPMRHYWLDIGKPEDFRRAQEDIEHLNL